MHHCEQRSLGKNIMQAIIVIGVLLGTTLAMPGPPSSSDLQLSNQDLHTEATGVHGGYAYYPGIGQTYPFGGFYPAQYGQYPSEYGNYYHPQYSQYSYQVPQYNPFSYNQRYQ